MAGFFVRSFSIGQVAKAAFYIHFKHTGVKKCHIHATNALSTEHTCAPNGAAQTRKDLPAGIAICMCHAIRARRRAEPKSLPILPVVAPSRLEDRRRPTRGLPRDHAADWADYQAQPQQVRRRA